MGFSLKVNLHLHSTLSMDSEFEPEDIVQKSINNGLRVIAFTDHIDFNPKDGSYGFYNYEKAREVVLALREKFGKYLNILFGGEVGYESIRDSEIRQYLKDKEFGFLVGSLHDVDNEIIKRWVPMVEKKKGRVYKPYYDEMYRLIESNLFDVIGHFDYYKKYSNNPEVARDLWVDYTKEIKNIFRLAIRRNMVLEINTSGLRQAPKEQYPAEGIIKLYKEIGGNYVSIGTDAHRPDHLMFGLERGYEIAKKYELKIKTFLP